ncbi:P-loop containing nucleoside triphosphate hydrolase protein [Annulohypoxylon truncatum]|uniref:P-loop containing nucleoside triphosphate hydrolase protein n=1 Tax=Annulohypoxylon truncatum TaxID=327061 RepID=UPI0020072907|nr:P-loop containing nucleoside triphosphate hydrolase protein [Annulohypoxylon truncatum]KAI1204533.1 P-loop containing nucleoside triphosphate hydrolase protein [Annulohypoxylon truncatum]
MYARYVPPPKGATKDPEPQNAVESTSTLPVNSQPTAYARYIPPIKPTNVQSNHHPPSHHVHFDEDDDNNEPPAKKARLAEGNDASQKLKTKSKKSKEFKKETESKAEELDEVSDEKVTQDASVNNDISVESDLPEQEVVQESAPESSPELIDKVKKERKSKKKAKKKSEPAAPDDVENEIPVRHRSVLEKAAKSIRAPEPQPETEQREDAEMRDVFNGDDAINTKPDGAMNLDEVPEVHGLQPLPQPKPIIPDETKPAYETLPPWLAKPIRVSPHSTAPFTQFGLSPDLGITPEVAEKLASNGYKQAFAIQTAVIPLLLPHHDKTMHGDVLVSAATGSGKTLAYTLPIIRDLSQGNRHLTRLRAVIVLPTRELVRQVQQVCEQCAGVFSLDGSKRRVRIGIAMGSQSLDKEQATLVEREEKYDPEAYARRKKRLASESGYGSGEDSDEGYNTEDEEKAAIQKREDDIPTLPDHVISYNSKVDILICTPGRLVDHIKSTLGFSLDFVRWLVVDEADKLLGQNFQQWLDVVMPRLQSDSMRSRNHKQSNLSGVRKVVLSATMTKDLDRLEGLKLRWPKLIMLEGSGTVDEPEPTLSKAELALPELLEEAALKVSDPNLKPLFLLDLLQSNHILGKLSSKYRQGLSDDETSSSDSDTESDSEVEAFKPSGATVARKELPSVLIFTKSNETALRLSRLLSLLSSALGNITGTLTSTTQYATRRRTIQSFLAGKLRILVASDLVARGIDLPSLDHVINYDVPSSVASYVHRVGRTARAGKKGKAWTLFTNREARWFWNEVASETAIQRNGNVERIRVTEEKEDEFDKKVAAYESALAKLGEEASESRHHAR